MLYHFCVKPTYLNLKDIFVANILHDNLAKSTEFKPDVKVPHKLLSSRKTSILTLIPKKTFSDAK